MIVVLGNTKEKQSKDVLAGGSTQYTALPPVRSKVNAVLKLASGETMNFVMAATSSKLQHL